MDCTEWLVIAPDWLGLHLWLLLWLGLIADVTVSVPDAFAFPGAMGVAVAELPWLELGLRRCWPVYQILHTHYAMQACSYDMCMHCAH